jgi:hypothetical protein
VITVDDHRDLERAVAPHLYQVLVAVEQIETTATQTFPWGCTISCFLRFGLREGQVGLRLTEFAPATPQPMSLMLRELRRARPLEPPAGVHLAVAAMAEQFSPRDRELLLPVPGESDADAVRRFCDALADSEQHARIVAGIMHDGVQFLAARTRVDGLRTFTVAPPEEELLGALREPLADINNDLVDMVLRRSR